METNDQYTNPGAGHIPPQQTGSEMNVVEKIELRSVPEAVYFFKIVKRRLLEVNRWSKIAGGGSSDFFLTDEQGNPVQRKATGGDHIRIDIPGPGTKAGDGYDWVTIEEVKAEVMDDTEVLSMTVRPSANPSGAAGGTAHFLTEDATSTFQVKRIGNTIYAEEHGRNEMPNVGMENALDNIRNAFVGWGAKAGLSYPQWKALVKGLLNPATPYQPAKS